ncbi:MAG: hypothetical protein Ct9H300mP11_02960 [Chloroflexota bacterium]|nr:MAG: hypothetical protein Ct9H300mP11_02960 [Chloroflexota bacterium]
MDHAQQLEVCAENFAGDGYHNISHRSVDMVGIGPSGQNRRDYGEYSPGRRLNVSFPIGSRRGGRRPTYRPANPLHTLTPRSSKNILESKKSNGGETLAGKPNLIGWLEQCSPTCPILHDSRARSHVASKGPQ